jgi:hypothetical protein
LVARETEVRTVVIDHSRLLGWGRWLLRLRRLALGMAALCVTDARSHSLLTDDVRTGMSQGPIDADRLLAVLPLPAPRDFPVAAVVEGTSQLARAGLLRCVRAWVPRTVARITEAPLTAAGLFWIALEALARLVTVSLANAARKPGKY